jgi:hypothetical protein
MRIESEKQGRKQHKTTQDPCIHEHMWAWVKIDPVKQSLSTGETGRFFFDSIDLHGIPTQWINP